MDYSKEYFPLSNLILWRKGWYQWSAGNWSDIKPVMKDIREMLRYDGYPVKFISDDDIFNLIIRKYDEYFLWAYSNNVPGFYNPVLSIVTGTYHNIYPDLPFKYRMVLEILAKLAWTETKYLKLKCPHYDKHTYKIGCYKSGMTYAWMNKHAQKTFIN